MAYPSWLKLKPSEAIAYWLSKIPVPLGDYSNMPEGYHAWAYSMASIYKAQSIERLHWVIRNALENGASRETAIKQAKRLLRDQTWVPSDNRLAFMFDQNIRGALANGRSLQMSAIDQEADGDQDVLVWRWRDSRQPRPHHQALHNKAIPVNSPFWQQCSLPAGFGCRCSVYRVSRAYAERNGIEILEDPPDPLDIADPGFRYPLAGTMSDSHRKQIIAESLKKLDKKLAKKVRADLKKKGLL